MSKTAATLTASAAAGGLGWLAAAGQLTGQINLANAAGVILALVVCASIGILLFGHTTDEVSDTAPAAEEAAGTQTAEPSTADVAAGDAETAEVDLANATAASTVPDSATHTAAPAADRAFGTASHLAQSRSAMVGGGETTAAATLTEDRPPQQPPLQAAPVTAWKTDRRPHGRNGAAKADKATGNGATNGSAPVGDEPAAASDPGDTKPLAEVTRELSVNDFRRKLATAQRGAISDLVADGTLSSQGPITDSDVATLTFMAVTANELVAQFANGSFVGPDFTPTDSLADAARFPVHS